MPDRPAAAISETVDRLRPADGVDDLFRRLEQLNDIGASLSRETDISALLEKGIATGKVKGEDAAAAHKRLTTCTRLEEAARDTRVRREFLEALEVDEGGHAALARGGRGPGESPQLGLFSRADERLAALREDLLGLDLDALRPIDALALLAEWKRRLG